MTPDREFFDGALDAAAKQQFVTLFLVLMADVHSPKALERFEAGVRRLTDHVAKANSVIDRVSPAEVAERDK
jgi:hypothetical protein